MDATYQQLGIGRLSPGERLELIGQIWDSLTEVEVLETVPEWHRRELDRRLAQAEAHPEAECSWEDVKTRLNWRS